MSASQKSIAQKYHEILDKWVESCRRDDEVSRNTVAVGIVVLDHLRHRCPVSRDDVISKGGELKGARSGLGKILEAYQVPREYLKEATTRQAPQDAQRLLDALEWGKALSGLPEEEREKLLLELIEVLSSQARDWLRRQNLKLQLERRQSPTTWVGLILDNAKERSEGIVEQHLIGAKLVRRFPNITVPNHPAHAADRQTARPGDFTISRIVYHVTAMPSRSVIDKCAENVKAGMQPVLLVPNGQEYKAKGLAEDGGIDKALAIISIEAFVGLNVIELATEEEKDFFTILKEIVEIYNKRLGEVETDLSLQIEVR